MFRHALKLTWNRRRANALVAIEVTVVFLVLFSLASSFYGMWKNYQVPLGYEWRNIWEVSLSVSGEWTVEDGQAARQAVDALRALPEVETAHIINITPFRNWNWTNTLGVETRVRTWINFMSVGGPQDLGVELVEGRWFGPEDEGQPYQPMVINREFRDRVFGPDDTVIGANINQNPSEYEEDREEYRVVGVMEEFRQRGEFFPVVPYAIGMYKEDESDIRANFLYVKVVPGTPAAFEENVLATVQGIAPEWGLSVKSWSRFREEKHNSVLMPVYIMATVAGFLLLMVALGLIGVLWQEVVRRTQEIGLRRALGAPTGMVRRQISFELIAVAAFGIVLGAVLGLQLPMLELIDGVNWQTAPVGLLIATLTILAVVFGSSLYPSWVASRSTPAEALRHE